MARHRRKAAPWIAYHERSRAGLWPSREAAIEALDKGPPFNAGRASVFHRDTKECWSRRGGEWVRTDHRSGAVPGGPAQPDRIPCRGRAASPPPGDPALEEIDPGGDGRAAQWWLDQD